MASKPKVCPFRVGEIVEYAGGLWHIASMKTFKTTYSMYLREMNENLGDIAAIKSGLYGRLREVKDTDEKLIIRATLFGQSSIKDFFSDHKDDHAVAGSVVLYNNKILTVNRTKAQVRYSIANDKFFFDGVATLSDGTRCYLHNLCVIGEDLEE